MKLIFYSNTSYLSHTSVYSVLTNTHATKCLLRHCTGAEWIFRLSIPRRVSRYVFGYIRHILSSKWYDSWHIFMSIHQMKNWSNHWMQMLMAWFKLLIDYTREPFKFLEQLFQLGISTYVTSPNIVFKEHISLSFMLSRVLK